MNDPAFDDIMKLVERSPRAREAVIEWASEKIAEFAIERDLPMRKAIEQWFNEEIAKYEMTVNTKQ